MSEILVAIILNAVAAIILVCGIFTALSDGWKISLTKLVLTAAGSVGIYFLTPYLSDLVWDIPGVKETAQHVLYTTQATISSCIFFLLFIVLILLVLMICSIVKHILIKNMQKSTSSNRAKAKRAKSINPKADREMRKAMWKNLKNEYRATNGFIKRLFSVLMGVVVSAAIYFVTMLPFHYIVKDLNRNKADEFSYLSKGYEYTLNGVVGETTMDWIIGVESDDESDELPPVEPPTSTGDEVVTE